MAVSSTGLLFVKLVQTPCSVIIFPSLILLALFFVAPYLPSGSPGSLENKQLADLKSDVNRSIAKATFLAGHMPKSEQRLKI